MPSPPLRVAVVEDVPLFRRLLEGIIEETSELLLVATAGTAHQARTTIPPVDPDVVLLDLHLPDGHGFDIGVELRRRMPHVRIVILSEHVRPHVLDMLPPEESTAWSYVLKANVKSADDLVSVIKAPRPRIDPAVSRARAEQDGALALLSDRQREILRLVAAGYSNAAIAQELHIQSKSVEYHLTQIYATLGLKDDAMRNARVQASLRFSRHD